MAAFAEFLRGDRGLAPVTIDGCCSVLRQFLGRLCSADVSLREVTPTQIDAVLIEQATDGHYARSTVRDRATTLRAFFRFAAARGWCRPDLAAAIKAPRVFAQETI